MITASFSGKATSAKASGNLAVRSEPEAIASEDTSVAFKRDYEERAEVLAAEISLVEGEATELFSDIAAAARDAKAKAADRRAKSLMQGYTGNMCMECQNFTMVRNGTCEKCDTCGSTSGCS